MLYVNREDVETLLTYDECIAACEEVLAAKARGEAVEVPRIHVNAGKGPVMFQISSMPGKGVAGMRAFGGKPVRLLYILGTLRRTRLCHHQPTPQALVS